MPRPSTRLDFQTVCIVLTALAVLFLFGACSSTPKVNDSARSGFHLKKRVCITHFADKKQFDDTYLDRPFQDQLTDALLSTCKKPDFILPGQKEFPEEFNNLPVMQSGLVDNMALMDIGRKNGFNAVIVGYISDIRQSNEEGWLQGDQSYVQVTVTSEVFDTHTGAKRMDKTFLHEVEVDVAEASETEKEAEYFDIIAIKKAFSRIVEDMRDDICKTISDMPWNGFIIDTVGDKVVVSAGKKAGLRPGDRLDVYQNDQVMTGAFGSRYRIPGPKLGELELVTVSDGQSQAVLIEGTGAIPGNSVRFK